jgi:hypothetical protein
VTYEDTTMVGIREVSIVAWPKHIGACCWPRDRDVEDLPAEVRGPALWWEQGLRAYWANIAKRNTQRIARLQNSGQPPLTVSCPQRRLGNIRRQRGLRTGGWLGMGALGGVDRHQLKTPVPCWMIVTAMPFSFCPFGMTLLASSSKFS